MVRNLSGALIWSVVALGVWLLTLSAFSWSEILVGAACSILVGVIAVAAQRAVGARWKPTAASLRPLIFLPLAIVSDAVQVLTLPLWRRRVRGHFETIDIVAAGSSPQAATRRAIATLGTTATPASVVVDVDDDEGAMIIHGLPTSGFRMERGFAKR